MAFLITLKFTPDDIIFLGPVLEVSDYCCMTRLIIKKCPIAMHSCMTDLFVSLQPTHLANFNQVQSIQYSALEEKDRKGMLQLNVAGAPEVKNAHTIHKGDSCNAVINYFTPLNQRLTTHIHWSRNPFFFLNKYFPL